MNTERDILQILWESIQAGGAGASIGRNVFQAKDPTKMVRAMAKIVHEGYEVDEAMKVLQP